MSELIEPEQAKEIAKRLFLDTFPDSERWFVLAWQSSLTRTDSAASGLALTTGLGVGPGMDPCLENMAREFAICFDTFMLKYPIVQEALLERLELACKTRGKSHRATERLRARLRSNLAPIGDFVAWFATDSQPSATTQYLSAHQAAVVAAKEQDYDIFINGDRVSIKDEYGRIEIALPSRLLWLLIMLLRYRNRPIPPEESYRKAWGLLRLGSDSDLKDIVQRFLRFAISSLRRQLQGLSERVDFEIQKPRDGGYRCVGHFSFCIILAREFEARVTLNII